MNSISFTVPGAPVGKGRGAKKASDAQILAAYGEHGSCKKAAAVLGMCPQSVHERLVKLGKNNKTPVFSPEEKLILVQEHQAHADSGSLEALAKRMGRTKSGICRMAGILGLTDRNRLRPYIGEAISLSRKEWLKTNPHPRGMQGKRHTQATTDIISAASIARWAAMTDDQRTDFTLKQMKAKFAKGPNTKGRNASWKAGWREVGDRRVFFRSRWEANYGRYLEWLKSIDNILEWEHEPEVFWFEAIKRGVRSYLPDFRVTELDGSIVYHEVKGWMDDRSKTCIKRMRIYHPEVKLLVIDAKAYRSIAKKAKSFVPMWEAEEKKSPIPRVEVRVHEYEMKESA